MKHFPYSLIALLVIAAAIVIVVILVHGKSSSPSSPVNTATLTSALWQDYKHRYWHADSGQAFDPASHTTTSEAQGYTMLRAVWENDRSTFQQTWQWTSQHLQRSDKLFSWQWGKRSDGSEGILTNNGGQDTASDADIGIALALMIAAGRWHDSNYESAAKAIIPNIWEQEVVIIQGKPYLTADNLEQNSPTPLLNPSYFSPAAYRVFATVDRQHPWNQLTQQSYLTVQAASQQQLGSDKTAGLPPNWVQIDRSTGHLQAAKGHDTDFGFDALRTVWYAALDYEWNHAATAKSTLASFSALTDYWNHDHKLYAIYSHAGQPTVNYSSIAMYGGTLGYFSIIHPKLAAAIYASQLAPLYDATHHRLAKTLNYYDNNWAWFGVALYGHQLPQPKPYGARQS